MGRRVEPGLHPAAEQPAAVTPHVAIVIQQARRHPLVPHLMLDTAAGQARGIVRPQELYQVVRDMMRAGRELAQRSVENLAQGRPTVSTWPHTDIIDV